MNVIVRNTILSVFSLMLFLGLPQAGQALEISVYDYDTQMSEINAWMDGKSGRVLEDFEGFAEDDLGWHQSLDTNVGNFSIVDGVTQAGTGTSSYYEKTGGDGAYFELRNYNEDGRYNTTPEGGTQYLDTADISYFELAVDGNYSNLFFYMTDPSDIEANTTTGSSGETETIEYPKSNASRWFVGIDTLDDSEYITSISWLAWLDEETHSTDDGFGIDGFSTRVPEPATLLLLGTGLLGFAGFARRRRLAKN